MSVPSRAFALSLCLVSALSATPALSAPSPAAGVAGSVEGEVKDSTGAVIVGASVTLQDQPGDFRREAATDARGRFRFEGVPAGTYLVLAFRDGFSAQTQEVTVGASATAGAEITLSPASFSEEITVSFTGSHTAALKMDAPVKDIPLSIQSYTSSFIKAIEATNVADLYGYTLGVSRVAPNSSGMVIRGVRASAGGQNLQYNGLPGPTGRFGSPPLANVERIEVLKGPASVLYGQAEPGGIVNIVTLKPQTERSHVIDLRGGTYFGRGPGFGDANQGHFDVDLTGPVTRSRHLLYRFIASYDDNEGFRDFTDSSDLYVVPAVSWLGWSGTVINAEFEFRRVRAAADDGLVAPNNDISLVAPIDTRYQEPADFQDENVRTANFTVKKLFGQSLNWNATYRRVRSNDDTKRYGNGNIQASGNSFLLRRTDMRNVNHREYDFVDTTLQKDFATGSVRHRLLFGLNGGHEVSDFDRVQFSTAAGLAALAVDVYDPVYGKTVAPGPPDTHRLIDFWTYAAYLNDQIEITPKLKGLAGVRFTGHQTQQEELRINPGSTPEKSNSAVLPLGGLVFQPNDVWSLYGSYSASFVPPGAALRDASGNNPFDPERARQYEVGVKASLAGGRGEATVSWFDIAKKNVIVAVGGGISEQFGRQDSQGLEVQVNHRILDTWQVIAGYAYTESTLQQAAEANQVGRASTQVNSPKHAANFWSRYDIPRGQLRGLGLGLGFIYTAERAGTISTAASTAPPLILPSYVRVDAGLYYVASRYEVTARIVNVLDELYFEGTSGNANGVTPGAPRTATLSLRVKF